MNNEYSNSFAEWDEIARKIALTTVYSSDQACILISKLKHSGASADIYSEWLYNAISQTAFFSLAQCQADCVYLEHLAEMN